MTDDLSSTGSVGKANGIGERTRYWLLLVGNRFLLAGILLAGVFVCVFGLIRADLVAVGPSSSAATAFASGLISGTLTLVTIALSINQLILSRVFGSPGELQEKLDGARELRDRVRRCAEEPSVPLDPAAFLALTGRTIGDRVERFGDAVEQSEWTPPAAVESYVDNVGAYGAAIDSHLEPNQSIVESLDVIIGTEYAYNLTATEHLHNRYEGDLSEAATAELEAIDELLEVVAVSRQFFKTLALQEDFAHLSRIIAGTGLLALLASILLALVYRTNSVTIPPDQLPLTIAVGLTLIVAPLAVFISYILRAATVAHRTLSAGPFIPPGGDSGSGDR